MKAHLRLALWFGIAIVIVIAIIPAETSGSGSGAGVSASREAALALGGGPDQKAAAPKRAKTSCAQYCADVEKASKHAAFDTRIKPGSWGRIPHALRKLPPRAKLCGVDSRGQAVIASPLFGKELEDYYTPLFTKLEFAPLTCQITAEQTQCRSKRRRDIGILVTDAASDIFVLAVVSR